MSAGYGTFRQEIARARAEREVFLAEHGIIPAPDRGPASLSGNPGQQLLAMIAVAVNRLTWRV